ncbi:MAG: hypothetical protein SFV23_11575 [Planctomycetaceae bacterium]|nr:hypothetical protein [Planctomycetaceae bacterium]
MLRECRLIIEPEPADGAWNMAVDEALLESAIRGGSATLRWYQWREPTLSLGYFQSLNDIDLRWRGLPQVRRLTGGGAILHDREWTYSCVLPADQTLVRHPYDLYDVIHKAVIAWFETTCGLTLSLRGATHHAESEPTLCFLRQDSHDVCFHDQKVLGSAQRRRRGALLQHGSLILQRSPVAPEIAGFCDLAASTAFLDRRSSLAEFVAAAVGDVITPGELSVEELSAAQTLRAEKSTKAPPPSGMEQPSKA